MEQKATGLWVLFRREKMRVFPNERVQSPRYNYPTGPRSLAKGVIKL